MPELKSIKKEAIPRALEKAERYRLLNDPTEAESICRDILFIEPENQEAIVMLILTLTDQFNLGTTIQEANSLLSQLKDAYKREYYRGLILEREGKAAASREFPDSKHDAYEWLKEAMESFSKAELLRPSDNDEAILRFNACARTIEKNRLTARPKEDKRKLHEPLE